MTAVEAPTPLGGMVICRPAPLLYETGGEQGFTFMSDLHVGARNVNYGLIEHELAQAKKHGDRVFLNGDVLDMILCGDRKRFRPDCVHPRLAGRGDLADAAVDWAAEILGPYADIIDGVGVGNHEEAVLHHHSVDVTKALVRELRKRRKDKDHTVHYAGYCGFLDYRLRCRADVKKKLPPRSQHGRRFVVFYHHGAGGSAPVTKGMIDFHRLGGWADADVLLLGHKHNRIASHVQRVSCPQDGSEPVVKDVRHVMAGSYFETYRGQTQQSVERHGRITNYAADRGLAPQGQGGARVVLTFGPSHNDPYRVRVVQ